MEPAPPLPGSFRAPTFVFSGYNFEKDIFFTLFDEKIEKSGKKLDLKGPERQPHHLSWFLAPLCIGILERVRAVCVGQCECLP